MIVVCGEALVDLVPSGPTGQGTFSALPGGSPANTALALSRLGQAVELWTRLGDDDLGDLVAAHLAGNGVGLAALERSGEPTSLAVVSLGSEGEARYHLYLEGTASFGWRFEVPAVLAAGGAEAFHTGSLALASPATRGDLLDLMDKERRRRVVSFDPNVRLGAVGPVGPYRTAVEAAVGRAHLVRASEDDLVALYPELGVEEAAQRWWDLGPRLVVVTRGPAGALAVLGGERVVGPVRTTTVVDTVAAGDTFTAALLAHLAGTGALSDRLEALDADAVAAALVYATAAASLACGRRGADPPTAAELAALLGR